MDSESGGPTLIPMHAPVWLSYRSTLIGQHELLRKRKHPALARKS
jgi:hypothetical protein